MNYKRYIAEFTGTFCLVFCGTGAIIVDHQTQGQIGHAGVSAVFGLIVMAMIYTFGNTSGAHINPAVTIGFLLAGLFNKNMVIPYILSQFAGALTASITLKLIFPTDIMLGGSLPAGSSCQSFILELILTFILMLVIFKTSQGSKETGILAGIAIGATVLVEAMFAGPITGASMNPARSMAPAIVSGQTSALWIYLTAPVIGVGLAAFYHHLTSIPALENS